MIGLNKYTSLSNMLESDKFGDECLDFVELHGYLTASLISPETCDFNQLMDEIMGDNASASTEIVEILTSEVEILRNEISQELLASEPIEMPCEIEIGESDDMPSDLERWCIAFTEKHLLDEELWFAVNERAVAELMLPIISASGLFNDTEIASILEDDGLFVSMIEQIPEVVVDLYGLFHCDA